MILPFFLCDENPPVYFLVQARNRVGTFKMSTKIAREPVRALRVDTFTSCVPRIRASVGVKDQSRVLQCISSHTVLVPVSDLLGL